MRALLLLWLWGVAVCSKPEKLPDLKDDTTCVTPETSWYRPEDHHEHLLAFLQEIKEAIEPLYSCIDLFGASNRVRDTWRKHGYDAISMDIKHDPSHDLTSEVGFKTFLKYGLKLKKEGIVVAGPPCSMFSPCCSSVHRRTKRNPAGNLRNRKVRIAQRVWMSFALAIWLLHLVRPDLLFLVEQPGGSWAFKQHFMLSISAAMNLICVSTYMGFFKHDLCKHTHLKTNLRTIQSLKRTMKKSSREKVKRRFARRQRRRGVEKVYHKRLPPKQGKKNRWQGGRDLASSAVYTFAFCEAIFLCWEHRHSKQQEDIVPVDPLLSDSDSESQG